MSEFFRFTLELIMFGSVGIFSIYSAVSAAPLGLSVFCLSALLFAFAGACYSIYNMLSQGRTA